MPYWEWYSRLTGQYKELRRHHGLGSDCLYHCKPSRFQVPISHVRRQGVLFRLSANPVTGSLSGRSRVFSLLRVCPPIVANQDVPRVPPYLFHASNAQYHISCFRGVTGLSPLLGSHSRLAVRLLQLTYLVARVYHKFSLATHLSQNPSRDFLSLCELTSDCYQFTRFRLLTRSISLRIPP